MAKKAKKASKEENIKSQPSNSEAKDITRQWKSAWDYFHPIRATWDEKEALVVASLKDSISQNTKSQVYDPRLLTIVLERVYRVMAQLPSGKVQALSKKDRGKSLFMDLALNNYVVPNATTQFDILTKHRMVDFYSNLYGSFGCLVDWVVRDDYIGPDYYMIPIRDLVPQPKKISIDDCDYVFVKTKVSRAWLKQRDTKTWVNIDKVLEASKGKQGTTYKDMEDQSFVEHKFDDIFSEEFDNHREVTLVTKYMRDRWVTVAPDFNLIVRDIENPHKNGKLPVVVKHAFPLIDRFHGLGEFEKGMSLQHAINSLINLYLDGVKYSIFPPTKIDLAGVVPSTIKLEPGAKWIIKNGQMEAIQSHQISPQGTQTFQQTFSFLVSEVLNLAGTTDTSNADGIDPAMGKTPHAIQFLSQRQNARDAWDRFMMEKFVEDVYDRFIDLLVCKQEKPIKMHLFDEELQQIAKYNPDVVDIFESGQAGELTIKPMDIKETNYMFRIDAGSSYKRDELAEKQEIDAKIAMILQLPGAPEQIAQTGGVAMGDTYIDFAELLKRSGMTSGIQDWEKIFLSLEEAQAEGKLGDMGMGNMPMQEQMPQDPMDVRLQEIMQELQAPEQVMGAQEDYGF
jgi:hypothetical protein